MPPVVDPVHYGIQSAEPLWPIRGPKLPALQHLQLPEATAGSSSVSADRRWSRPRQTSRLQGLPVTQPRMANPHQRSDHHQGDLSTTLRPPARVHRPIHQPIRHHHPQQRLIQHRPVQHPVERQHIQQALPIRRQQIQQPVMKQSNRRHDIQQHIIQQQLIKQQPPQKPLPQYIRQPVTQTAWTNYDYSTNRPLGRAAAIGPALLSTPMPLFKPSTALPPSQHQQQSPNTIALPSINRFVSVNSGRSFGSSQISSDGDKAPTEGRTIESLSSISSDVVTSRSIDRSDDASSAVDDQVEVTLSSNSRERKRSRMPFQFIIQQGHSKVRKYGAAESSTDWNFSSNGTNVISVSSIHDRSPSIWDGKWKDQVQFKFK